MPAPQNQNECKRHRLRLSLDDRLSQSEQAELAAHLEACPACRRELEGMAAASHFWGDAALLRGEPWAAKAATGVHSDPLANFDDDDRPDAAGLDGRWLDFLDPSDPERPEALGRLGPYDILEVLGRGGMGIVLKGRDPALERTVAIKVLAPTLAHSASARRRFAREARAVAAVVHEHIIAIHAVDEFHGLPYLVMEYVSGRSVQDKLDASGPLEIREILRIGMQAAHALAAAHAQGVVHRDIKPANILLENCVERVKLTDFGLARAIDDASLTQSGVIAGTPQYMAPEQARGEPVDARADLFALGAAIYAMACGRSPFRADSAMAVLKRVCDVRHASIRELNPDVPPWLAAIVDRLLAKEPADRFQTAAEVADLLEGGLAHLQQPESLPPPVVDAAEAILSKPDAFDLELDPPDLPPARRRLRPLSIAAALLLVAITGIGVTDAAGLTQVSDFVATILRIKTADGALIVKVEDPAVKVQVDGDEIVIGGTGQQEVRLRPGRHRVQATRDGRPVRDDFVTISRGGKEIVNITFEPAVAFLAPPEAPSPYVAGVGALPSPNPYVAPVGALPSPNPYAIGSAAPAPTSVPVPEGSTLPPVAPAERAGTPSSIPITPADPSDAPVLQPGGPAPAHSLPAPASGAPPGEPARSVNPPAPSALPQPTVAPSPAATTPSASGSSDVRLPSVVAKRVSTYGMVCALEFSPDGRTLAIGQQCVGKPESIVSIWQVADHGAVFCLHHPFGFGGLAFAPDGRGLATGLKDGTVTIFDDIHARTMGESENQGSAVTCVVFLAKSSLVAAGDRNGWVRFHGPAGKTKLQPIRYPGAVLSLASSPDGSMLAVGGDAKVVHIYDLVKQELKAILEGHTRPIESLDFSSDGKLLASAGGSTVRLWDTTTWKSKGERFQLNPPALCVRFSPDAKTLALSDGDKYFQHEKSEATVIILWNLAAGAEVLRLSGHKNAICALAFSPDGRILASGSTDQTVKLWSTHTGELRETIGPADTNTSRPRAE